MPGLKPSFVRWFPQDWLLSPSVNRLTLAQQGCYFRLLLHAYLSDDGSISDDPDDLKFMSGGAERSDIEASLQLFEASLEGRCTHRIVRRELARMVRESDMQAESGRRGGISSGKSRRGNNQGRVASESGRVASKGRSHHDHYHDHDHSASAPPEGARSREMSTPQSVFQPSPAGSAPAARAGGAAPARPASAPVLPPREKWPLTESDYLNREGWRVHPVTGQDTPPDGWVSPPVAGGPVEPAAPREPEPPPKITREERAAAVRAQAAAIKAQATPEQLAEIEERLAAQDAAAHPAPAAVEGGDA